MDSIFSRVVFAAVVVTLLASILILVGGLANKNNQELRLSEMIEKLATDVVKSRSMLQSSNEERRRDKQLLVKLDEKIKALEANADVLNVFVKDSNKKMQILEQTIKEQKRSYEEFALKAKELEYNEKFLTELRNVLKMDGLPDEKLAEKVRQIVKNYEKLKKGSP